MADFEAVAPGVEVFHEQQAPGAEDPSPAEAAAPPADPPAPEAAPAADAVPDPASAVAQAAAVAARLVQLHDTVGGAEGAEVGSQLRR